MDNATGADVPLPDPHESEWRILRTQHYNVLIEGPASATNAALARLQPHLRSPIRRTPPHEPLSLRNGGPHALILEKVDALDADDQARLLEWLRGAGAVAQVVSTTEQPLFALVSSGAFDAALYYRLNVLLLQVK